MSVTMITGPSKRTAVRRLRQVLAGDIELVPTSSGATVIAGDLDELKFDPLTGAKIEVDDRNRIVAKVSGDGDLEIHSFKCESCNTHILASADVGHCAHCGNSLVANSVIQLSDLEESTVKKSSAKSSAKRPSVAADDLQVENLDSDIETEESTMEFDDEEVLESEDEMEGPDDEMAEESEDDVEDETGESEDDAEEEMVEESEDEIEDDLAEEEATDDLDTEIDEEQVLEEANSKDLVVTARNLASAARSFGRRARRRVLAAAKTNRTLAGQIKQLTASGGLQLELQGILAGECDCGYTVMASDEASRIECGACHTVIPKSMLTSATMTVSGDDMDEEDEVIIDAGDAEEENYDTEQLLEESEDDEIDSIGVEDEMAEESEDDLEVENESEEDMVEESEDGEDSEDDDDDSESEEDDEPPAAQAGYKAKAKKSCSEDEATEEKVDSVEELNMLESFSIEASDKLDMNFLVSSDSVPGWQFTINGLPVAHLREASLSKDFNDQKGFRNISFSQKVMAAVNADRSRAFETLASIGFEAYRVPCMTTAAATAMASRKIREARNAAVASANSAIKEFTRMLLVAHTGAVRGAFPDIKNPAKAAAFQTLSSAGVAGAHKIVGDVFASSMSEDYVKQLTAKAEELMAMEPKVRATLASHILQQDYIVAEEQATVDPEKEGEGEESIDSEGFTEMLESRTTVASAESAVDFVTRSRAVLRGRR